MPFSNKITPFSLEGDISRLQNLLDGPVRCSKALAKGFRTNLF
jgi:hypothetical protein